ncbi:sulfite exporter TauE/SafE family protein [Streptosporangium sp. NPDC000509]|uniref:sulfite exporter TauE/SafE family protein n=1 Tax=Streptosporangium sp. NPDC000509 TaxID=3366186 RepID=UPI003678AEF1
MDAADEGWAEAAGESRERRPPVSADVVAVFAGGLAAGLVAGASSCAAVQGGLLFGLSGSATGSGPARSLWPVGLFLLGRTATHVATGALLGLLGSAVRLGPETRAVLLVLAGLLVIGFAVGLLRRRHRGEGACGSGGAPDTAGRGIVRSVGLGAATILMPCGMTISTEIVAVSTGSVLGGAAVMAGFVVGTAPAIALLGVFVRVLTTARLVRLAAVVALVAGLWTVTSGLRLGGWTPGIATQAAVEEPSTGLRRDGTQVIEIWATERGYRPGVVRARAGVPTELVFRTVGTPGCTGLLTIGGRDVRLPTVVRLPAQERGRLRYVCSMGMYLGFIDFA